MKKILILIFILIPFSISAQVISQREKIKAEQMLHKEMLKKCSYITVASFPNNPPFGWADQKRVYDKTINYSDGMSMKILEQIAQELKFKINSVSYPTYEEAFKALLRNDIDLLAGFYFNPLMLTGAIRVITPTYFVNPITIFYRSDNPIDIKNLDDLYGLKIGIRKEEALDMQISRNFYKNTDIILFSDSESAFEALLLGEIDLLLGSLYGLETEKNRLKIGSKVEHGSHILENYGLFFALSSVSRCRNWETLISKEIKKINSSKKHLDLITELDRVYRQKYDKEPSLLSQLGLQEDETVQEELPFQVMNISLSEETQESINSQESTFISPEETT